MGCLLLIDDDKTDRFLIKKALLKQRQSLDLIELDQGHEAVTIIKAKQPTATLLDVRMPGLDGFDVLKMIRKEPDLADHPVYMVSGSEMPSDKALAEAAGANGFLTKPGSFNGYSDLAKTIDERVFGAA